MLWRDPARTQESDEDCALREELGQLLGLPVQARAFFEVEPTPKMIALAEDLRREALRRRHTARRRPMWMLMAAGLPLALAVGALASWGFQYKQRADALALAMVQKEQELHNLASKAAEGSRTQTAPQVQTPAPTAVAMVKNVPPQAKPKVRPNGELVLEVKPYQTPALDTQPVKGQ